MIAQPATPATFDLARVLRAGLLLGALGLLAACADDLPKSDNAPGISAAAPLPRPDRPELTQAALRRERAAQARAANRAAASAAETPASRNMRSYLQGVEDALIARGKMRTDDGSEIRLTPERLTEDFILVALHDEYVRDGDRLVSRSTPAPLRRWDRPISIRIEFGASVAPAQRARDRSDIAGYAARLQNASGHPVGLTGGDGNFDVLILSEDERRAMAPRLTALVPDIPPADVNALAELAPQNYCTVFAYSRGDSATYAQAVAVIRAETPPRLRKSCIHEEIAQGLGLANDSPLVRPSIFNDDEEFAYLTKHDELLLKILYDPRLRPGMTEAEARPIVMQIASELLATEA
ncbi:DUF2927 domain-containing protein [Paracoccus laeviglucosivorans]|uniref:DUF2927 domain-containing protein n=1 Tax=Paracoccus laeviglucosivorans TaxID=1197861 RepID=A0A521FLG3_9RHOB|nr:DUF2927 domain-containing protein [Paracoccus laeviglucosivorans]SMO97047.1 Protein of unknown function [Paracoccus laeviglucosivorans]